MTSLVVERPHGTHAGTPVTAAELARLEELWEAPAMDWYDDSENEDWVLFVVVGLSYAAALAYAAYCTSRGGHPNISLGWTGFKVQCNK